MAHIVFYILFHLTASIGVALSEGFTVLYQIIWGRAMPEHAYYLAVLIALSSAIFGLLGSCIHRLVRYISSKGTPDYYSVRKPINQLYLKSFIAPFCGALLTINYVSNTMGTPHVRGIMQSILTLTFTPFTIILSYFLLGHKPVLLEIMGAVGVVGGTLLAMVPDFAPSSCQRNITEFETLCYSLNNESTVLRKESRCLNGETHETELLWNFLFLLGIPVQVLQTIIGEYMAKKPTRMTSKSPSSDVGGISPLVSEQEEDDSTDVSIVGELDLNLAVAANNGWMFLFLVLAFGVAIIPGVTPTCDGVAHNLAFLGDHLKVAFQCSFTGSGGYSAETNANLSSGLHHLDDCKNAFALLFLQFVAVFVSQYFQLVLTKHHSATFMTTIMTIGPVLSIFFQIDPTLTFGYSRDLSGAVTSVYPLLGLLIIILSIIVYKIPYLAVVKRRYPRLAAKDDSPDSILPRLLDKRLRALVHEQHHGSGERLQLASMPSTGQNGYYGTMDER